tara:strand:+ start:1761 stop:2438 length:678 start_codon:yes stop_codon:yes gene_type:complete
MKLINHTDIGGLILAGGQSRRFNFRNKGLVAFKHKPMVAHVIERIGPQVGHLAVSCNTNIDQYSTICDQYRSLLGANQTWGTCLADSASSKLNGPLAGIEQHMKGLQPLYWFICSCDMPLIPKDIVSVLTQAMVKYERQACHIIDDQGHHQLAIIAEGKHAKAALSECSSIQAKGQNTTPGGKKDSIKHWLTQMGSLGVRFSGPVEQLASINTPQELSFIETTNR